MNLIYCDWKWVWNAHPDFHMSVLQNHCKTVPVFPTVRHTDGQREEATCLSVLWLICSDPYWSFLPLGISVNVQEIFVCKGSFKMIHSSTPLFTFVLYMWMFRLCHFAKFHQFPLLVNQFKVIYIILLSELERIKIMLRCVHYVNWRSKQWFTTV